MRYLRSLWLQLWITIAVAMVMLSLYAGVVQQLFPLVSTQKDSVERMISEAIGHQLTIEQLSGKLNLFSPALTLQGVTAGSDDPIHIQKIEAELDISASLYFRSFVFKRVIIDGVAVSFWQNQEGGWHWGDKNLVKRSILDPANNSSEIKEYPWLTWLQRQKSVVLSNWTIENTSQQGIEETLRVRRVEIRNFEDQHAIEGDIAWGREYLADIYLSARVHGDVWPLSNQNADVYLLVDRQDWTRWLPMVFIPENLDVAKLEVGVEAWLKLSGGDLQSLFLRGAIPELSVTTDEEKLRLTDGRLFIYGDKDGHDWHLRVLPEFDEPLPVHELRFSSVALDDTRGWHFSIPEADVGKVSDYALKLNVMPSVVDRYLTNLSPTGQVSDVRLSMMQGAFESFEIQTEVHNLGINSYKGIPQVRGADGLLHFNARHGVASVKEDDLSLHLIDVYDPEWHLEKLSATAFWAISSDEFDLSLQGLEAELEKTPIKGDLALRLPLFDSQMDPYIGLRLGVANGPAKLQTLLVPDIIDPSINQWLDEGLLSGSLSQVGYVLNGSLADVTPDNGLTSQLYLESEDVDIQYMPDWPVLKEVKGHLILNGGDLDAWITEANTLGGNVSGTKVEIRENGKSSDLYVAGTIAGSSSEALAYLQQTPLRETIEDALYDWKASGTAKTSLNLSIDLADEEALPDARLSTELTDTELLMEETELSFSDINGLIEFDTRVGLTATNLLAKTFGGDVALDVSSKPVADSYQLNLSAEGHAEWQPIKDWMQLFLMEPITGGLDYLAHITIQPGVDSPLHMLLETDLAGTQIDLPFPLGKASAETRQLTTHIHPLASGQSEIRMNYQDMLRSALLIDPIDQPRGEVIFGYLEPEIGEHTGIKVGGYIADSLNAEQWWDTWETMILLAEETEAKEKAEGSFIPVVPNALANTNPVSSVDLTIAQMDVWEMPSGVTKVNGSQQNNEWSLSVKNDLTEGKIIISEDVDAPIGLNLSYVHLPVPEEDSETTADADSQDELDPLYDVIPGDFAKFDIDIQELYVGTHNFGRWLITSRPIDDGLALEVIDSDTKGVHLQGRMNWVYKEGQHSTQLSNVVITAANVADIQKAFRQNAFIEGKNLDATIDMKWLGSPFLFNTQTLNGHLEARMRDGSVDFEGASAMRAVGALNFNSIFRRLRLDFTDVVSSGLAYDSISATANINDGVFRYVKPLTMEGPGGKIRTAGLADLNTGQLDMKLAVTFPVTNTLPLVAVLAGFTPQIAAGIYVTERLVGDELERFTSASYKIQGTIAEPQLELDSAFDNHVEGKKSKSIGQRILSIFGLDDDDD